MEHVASISYGKDSLAMLHVITEVLHLPLDRIITADEWATDDIPAELPEQIEFEKKMDGMILDRFGIQVEHVCALTKNGEKVTFEKEFYKVRRKASKREGEIVGFPRLFGCWANKRLKLRALDRIRDSVSGCIEYIGIAANETERIRRHEVKPNMLIRKSVSIGDGLMTSSAMDYQSRKHKAWREKVLRKAGYLCEECARYGRRTEATVAHHVKHADAFPELRYDPKNGRALCAACHNKEHPEKGGKVWRSE